MLSYTETWNVISSKKSKIWECPRGQQVTAHCFLSNRKEKLFKFSISWTDVFATKTNGYTSVDQFLVVLRSIDSLTPSEHHWMLKIFLHRNSFEKKNIPKSSTISTLCSTRLLKSLVFWNDRNHLSTPWMHLLSGLGRLPLWGGTWTCNQRGSTVQLNSMVAREEIQHRVKTNQKIWGKNTCESFQWDQSLGS